jgi:archaellum component FlaC
MLILKLGLSGVSPGRQDVSFPSLDQIYQKLDLSLNMFGRKKLECPRCKKMFRKKDMVDEEDYDSVKTVGDSFRYHNPTTDTWDETLCVDCYAKGQKIADEYNANFEKGKRDQEELIETWSHKASSSEKLSRLYQERPMLKTNYELLTSQLDTARDNASSDWLFTLDKKSDPAWQIATAEEARIEAEEKKAYEAFRRNTRDIETEIEKIEANADSCVTQTKRDGIKEPVGITESNVKRLQNLMDNTISEVISRAEQHSSNWQTKRDGIKEPVEQNNDNSFCDNCGKSLKPTAKFCGSCGTPRA